MPIAAIAFDAFGTLFDLGALRERMGAAGGRRDELLDAFRARLVPFSWHATASGHYRPFPEVAAAALGAAARSLDLELSERESEEIAAGLAELPAYPEVSDGLRALSDHRLAVLSNGTAEGVRSLVAGAAIEEHFEHLLVADTVRRFKPAPEVYRLAVDAFGVPAADILLVSGNEWDVAGAKQAGLRGAWLARGRTFVPVMGVEPDVVAEDVVALAAALAR